MKFKLLTTAIVTALHASEPSPAGAVWDAVEHNDILEGNALVTAGLASEAGKGDEVTHETVASRQAAKLAAEGEDAERAGLSGVRFDAIRQDDGTYRNARGDLVNEDGTPFDAAAFARNQASGRKSEPAATEAPAKSTKK